VNFDRIAPHYRWLERLVFGDRLQAARTAFVRQISPAQRALVVGEGNGRFLEVLLREHQSVRVDCLDASTRMLGLARRHAGEERVRYLHADIRQAQLLVASYDLIVTHFFLDCLTETELRHVIARLSRAAKDRATWLIADFCLPSHGWSRMRARLLISAMYFFFRAVAGIEARCLLDYAPLLSTEGFTLTNEVFSPNEMIRSQIWQR
jgi:ubiquinone/menaquinone biosynthesis C-methylase UbiE